LEPGLVRAEPFCNLLAARPFRVVDAMMLSATSLTKVTFAKATFAAFGPLLKQPFIIIIINKIHSLLK
jgi:hypothetical protein